MAKHCQRSFFQRRRTQKEKRERCRNEHTDRPEPEGIAEPNLDGSNFYFCMNPLENPAHTRHTNVLDAFDFCAASVFFSISTLLLHFSLACASRSEAKETGRLQNALATVLFLFSPNRVSGYAPSTASRARGERSINQVYSPFQPNLTVPNAPLRCLAIMTSAMFFSAVSGS